MILYHWRGVERNFGDELNTLLWPALLPGWFDSDPGALFLGIGSILDGRHDPRPLKLVAGSGYGGYERRITLDETWRVHWVRGPRTARLLGLPPRLGIGDPGSLIAHAMPPQPAQSGGGIAFMPHFESASRGAWAEAAAAAGVTLIDPRGDPTAIIAAIARCRLLISEALHGVIVADALRRPWVALQPLAPIHRPKWFDWADTLGLRLTFHHLAPSSTLERAHLSPFTRYHAGRTWLRRHGGTLRAIARDRHIERAAMTLRRAAMADPLLSTDIAFDRTRDRMLDAIDGLRRAAWIEPGPARYRPAIAPAIAIAMDAPLLPVAADSAYDPLPG
jgi:succinoglycan biosynthesis protein ExoV